MTYDQYVNQWLDSAIILHQPPEASRDNVLMDEIVRLVDGLANGDTADDLDQGMALDVNGRRAFKSRTLATSGRDSQLGEIGTHELCSLLRELGCRPRTIWRDGKSLRVWIAPSSWPTPPDHDEHTDDEEVQP